MKGKLGRWLFCGLEAVLYAAGLLGLSQLVPEWGRWYSASLVPRLQTVAMLHGHLVLSRNPSALGSDLAWANGGVQQVWGLGVPTWRLGFEWVAQMLGYGAFPDRLALGVALALAAFLLLKSWVDGRISPSLGGEARGGGSSREWAPGLGVALILLFFPGFMHLLHTHFGVVEEVLAYVYLYGIVLMVGVNALKCKSGGWRYALVCALAGLGAFVRPTLVFYGLATVAVSLALEAARKAGKPKDTEAAGASDGAGGHLDGDHNSGLSAGPYRRRVGWLWLGPALFAGGIGLLLLTNRARFGGWFEFGHRLNVQTLTGSMYSTRFDYPFWREPWWRAGRELLGALFFASGPTHFNDVQFYRRGIIPGQSPTLRWRFFYFSAFNASVIPLILLGWGFALFDGWRLLLRWRAVGWRGSLEVSGPAVLGAWSLIAFVPLALFYMWTPVIASRYMLDFAPAFGAATAAAWLGLAANRRRWLQILLFMALLGWLAAPWDWSRGGTGLAQTLTWPEVQERLSRRPSAIELPSRAYRLGDDMAATGIPLNGEGWDTKTGWVKPLVVLFVKDPQFLELDLTPAPGRKVSRADADRIRAKVGLEFLQRQQVERISNGWRVWFAGPAQAQYQKGIQPVFLAMVQPAHLADTGTPWRLKRVRWK